MELKNLQFSDIESLLKKLNKKEVKAHGPRAGMASTAKAPWFKKHVLPTLQKSKSLGPLEKLNKISIKCQEKAKLIKENHESIQNYPFFSDLYHIAIHPKMLLRAFLSVLKDKETRAIDSQKIKNYSMERIIDLHQSLKKSTYVPQPFVKVWIPNPQPLEMKKSLVVSTLDDSIVQESIRFILVKIYEPMFQIYNSLYGFKKWNRSSVREAIKKLYRDSWSSRYAIQGNMKETLATIHKKKLLSVLEKNIKDKKLINLIDKFLKAKKWGEKKIQDTETDDRSKEGSCSLVSLLFNIYMQQFDVFLEIEVKQFIKTINSKQKRRANLYSQIKTKDERFLNNRIVYIRYVENWIVMIFGTRGFSQLIKNKIQTFLKTQLELQSFPEIIFITNIQKNWIYFLGFAIQVKKKKNIANSVQLKQM